MQTKSELRVTLDACIIFRLALCDTLLNLAERKLYQPIWSKKILEEVFRTARKNLSREKNIGLENRVYQMNKSFTEAIFEGPVGLVAQLKPLLPDTDDAHVIATAVASESRFIVTENLRDYPANLLHTFGIEALSFDTFLNLLFAGDPDKVMDGLATLVESKSKPTISLREHLLQLESYSPNFNRKVREHVLNNF